MSRSEPAAEGPSPRPDLSPGQVVRIPLDALRPNDDPGQGQGFATAFRFASEANRAFSGPMPRFASMLRNPLDRPSLDLASTEFGPIQLEGGIARVPVVLFGRSGEVASYDFTRSKDETTGGWLTDSVILAPVGMA